MLLQAITIDERAYDVEKAKRSFANTHVFPGGCLPSLGGDRALGRARHRPAADRARGHHRALRAARCAAGARTSSPSSSACARSATTGASSACGSSTSPTARAASAAGGSPTCSCCSPSRTTRAVIGRRRATGRSPPRPDVARGAVRKRRGAAGSKRRVIAIGSSTGSKRSIARRRAEQSYPHAGLEPGRQDDLGGDDRRVLVEHLVERLAAEHSVAEEGGGFVEQ